MMFLSRLSDLRLRTKSVIGLSVLVGITLLVVILSIAASKTANRSMDRVNILNVPRLRVSTEARSHLLKILTNVRGHLVTGDDYYLKNNEADIMLFIKNLEKLVRLSTTSDDPIQLNHLAQIRTTFAEWRVLSEQLLELHDNPRRNQPALRIAHLEIEPLYRSALADIDEIILVQERFDSSVERDKLLKVFIRLRSSFNEMVYSLRGFASVGDMTFRYLYATSLIRDDALNAGLNKKLLLLKGELRTGFDDFTAKRKQILELASKIESLIRGDRTYESLYLFREEAVPRAERMVMMLDEIISEDQKSLQTELTKAREKLTMVQWQLFVAGIVALLLGIGLVLLFKRIMIKPIEQLTQGALRIADGDFTIRTDVEHEDEIGCLAKSFNFMTDQLHQTIESLTEHRNELDKLVAERTKELTESNRLLMIENTDRKNAQEALTASEKRFYDLAENSTDWFWEIDENEIFTYVSSGILSLLGVKPHDILGQSVFALLSENEAEEFTKEFSEYKKARKPFSSLINVIKHKSGKDVIVESSGVPIIDKEGTFHGYRGIDRNITERKSIEEQLRHSTKMDAIGQLAGGIAHDFNNQLAGVMGYAEMLSIKLDDPKLNRYAQGIISAADTASSLTQKLLSFARKQPTASTAVDLHISVNDAVLLLKSTIDKLVNIEFNPQADESCIVGDPAQLQSVFLNIGINASHAMPSGGTIYIDSRNIDLDSHYCELSNFDIEPGSYVEVEVRDTGTGISEENLLKIFEPFFTTKEQGKGTGLGLAAVYGTVQQHKGMIEARSVLGKGTSFHLLFPLADSDSPMSLDVKPSVVSGSGCVLVIDDEEIMRSLCKDILTELGYEVLLAENGERGVEVFKQNVDTIELVILDMIMPVMNGRDCFKALRNIKPDVQVVLSSGFSREEDLEDIKAAGNVPFIKKPYSLSNLSHLLKDTLN